MADRSATFRTDISLAVVDRSDPCAYGEHGMCGHKMAMEVSGFFRRRTSTALCQCDCHKPCALSGRARVPDSEWNDNCTCAGAQAWRAAGTWAHERARRPPEQ